MKYKYSVLENGLEKIKNTVATYAGDDNIDIINDITNTLIEKLIKNLSEDDNSSKIAIGSADYKFYVSAEKRHYNEKDYMLYNLEYCIGKGDVEFTFKYVPLIKRDKIEYRLVVDDDNNRDAYRQLKELLDGDIYMDMLSKYINSDHFDRKKMPKLRIFNEYYALLSSDYNILEVYAETNQSVLICYLNIVDNEGNYVSAKDI